MAAPQTQMFSFSFTPEARKFQVAFEGWAKEVKDWRRAWKDVRSLFQSHERRHFGSEGATTGGKFAPLMGRKYFRRDNLSYSEWKARSYPGLPIMQRDRVLYAALVEGGQGSLFRSGKTKMEIGIKQNARAVTAVAGDYSLYKMASAHQTGNPDSNAYAGLNKEPRPPVRFDPSVSDKGAFGYALSQVMQAHIALARRRVFGPQIEAAFGKAHADSESGARATIRSMINGTWK